MPEWLVEEGIGEDRAVLLDGGEIAAARIDWHEDLRAGLIAEAVLVSKATGRVRGTARFASGEEALVDRLPAGAAEGSRIRLEITRPAITERARLKRAHARPTDAAPRPAPTLAERLRGEGHEARIVARFAGDWDELVAEALAAEAAFAGGGLCFSTTPAMLLIDVDGTLPPRALALAAIPTLGSALRRFDIGGSVGIDFPTLAAKADRQAVDHALAKALVRWPHERTAMNGFGFVQLVARLERLSLLERAAGDRAGMAARLLLRRAEALEGPGALLLRSHPAVDAQLRPGWIEALARRTGRDVRCEAGTALAIEAPHAQLVPR